MNVCCESVCTHAEPTPKVFLGMTAVIASESMQNLLATVERVARSNATVLITGESGTGKEVIARAIHHFSFRAARPWVDLSCAALPEHLLESELFGYDKGAFSGANNHKPGLFELADRGTIFLDEIAELDPKMQVKLLRVLDGAPYYRLGGVRKVTADVRVVAATNRHLEQAVEDGRFRSDLYYRLSQFTLRVPPLRDRAADIIPLASHFLQEQNPGLRFSAAAEQVLLRHSWPGNVRELRNAVVKAALLANGDEVGPKLLPEEHWPLVVGSVGAAPASSLDGMERRMILEALTATGGHQQQAAARLGISRRTLSRKLKIYAAERAAS